MKEPRTSSENMIEEHYEGDSDCIKSYPDAEDATCLSESVGLYMAYLLEVDDKNEFAEQVSVLKKQFINKIQKNIFIR